MYKEDFDNEKSDRTKAHEEVITCKNTIEGLKSDIALMKSQNATLLNESNHLRKSIHENEVKKNNWDEERAGIDQQLRVYKTQVNDTRRQLAEEKEKRQQLDIQNAAKFQEVRNFTVYSFHYFMASSTIPLITFHIIILVMIAHFIRS